MANVSDDFLNVNDDSLNVNDDFLGLYDGVVTCAEPNIGDLELKFQENLIMAGNKDWYPTRIESLPEWYQNFVTQLQALATKYAIAVEQITAIQTDNAWIQYWVPALTTVDAQIEHLNNYFRTVLTLTEDVPAPKVPTLALPTPTPAALPVGVRTRARDIANFIKGNPLYSTADGELLGIVSINSEPPPLSEITAEFKLRTLANFGLEASFVKNGMDAIQQGGAWTLAAILTSSPGVFSIDPQVAGQPEQIELRGIMLKKNEPVGNFSDTKNAFIAP